MELIKFAPKEKGEEDIFREMAIKRHAILSSAFRLISEEYFLENGH